jgi:hypothetical protein
MAAHRAGVLALRTRVLILIIRGISQDRIENRYMEFGLQCPCGGPFQALGMTARDWGAQFRDLGASDRFAGEFGPCAKSASEIGGGVLREVPQ